MYAFMHTQSPTQKILHLDIIIEFLANYDNDNAFS